MTVCREYQGRRDDHGYGIVMFGPPFVNARGERNQRGPVRLHRWVVEQVEGPLAPGEVVMHTCDNPPCFLYEHLVRATQVANVADMDAKGRRTVLRGSASGNAKLTEDDVREIRRLSAEGYTRRALARRFGVTRQNITLIATGRSWGHLDPGLEP